MNKINFLQKKYVLPLLVLPFVIFIAYMINQFKPSESDSNLVEVEEFNSTLQDPVSTPENDDASAGKMDALKKRLRKEGDFTGIQNVETEVVEDEMIQNSSSLYTTNEMREIDSINQVNAIKAEELRQNIEMYRSRDYTKKNSDDSQKNGENFFAEQADELSEEEIQMRKIEAQIRKLDSLSKIKTTSIGQETRVGLEQSATQIINNESKSYTQQQTEVNNTKQHIVKVERTKGQNNDCFNTVGNNNYNLGISAILDESLKVVQGSRVRIRLLEDITLGGYRLSAGEYLYGTVRGFAAQRVLISITSIMVNGRPTKVNLSVYDIDGMEGFYVPASAFRDYTKEAAAKAVNQNISLESESNDIRQFSYKMLQDIYKSSTQALSKNIRQNKANLKYATQIYLVNKDEE